MVQRKVPSKLGIRADQFRSNKLLSSLKPSSLQHLDTKNKGADMKKKIKKSRSVKLSDFQCLSTTSLKGQVSQPGRPPPSATAASPQNKTPARTSENTPNYMKSTSSSAARKEQPQVSSKTRLPLFDSKSSSKKNSHNNISEATSANESERTPAARPSSLKLVRALTKTTTFKPARAPVNKCCSHLALSENLDVQRATCSSTLKDSKVPDYLTLEAEGTSAIKVCPYNYCSLNGHHHPPLPPLKSFLSSRRRMLKNQKSVNLGCLSPRRSKPNKEAMEEKEMGKSSSQAASGISVIQQKHDDFFIHIYSKGTSKPEEADPRPSDASPTNLGNSQCPESLLDESILSENSPEQNQNTEGLSKENDEESTGSVLTDDPDFGHNSDMDWEEGRDSIFYLDGEVDNSRQTSQDYDLEGEDKFVIHDRPIVELDGNFNRGFQDMDIQAKSFHVESMSQDFDIEHLQGSCNQTHDQLELTTMDEIKQSNCVEVSPNTSNPVEGPSPYSEDKTQADEVAPFGKTQPEDDAFDENEFVNEDDVAEQIPDLDSQDFHDMTGEHEDATGKQKNQAHVVINFQASSTKKKDSRSETNDAGFEANENFRANITIEIIIILQDLSGAMKMKSRKEDTEDNDLLEADQKDGKPNQTMDDIDPSAGTQEDHTSEAGGTENMNILEDQEATNFTSYESTDSEYQPENFKPDNAEEVSQDKEMEACPTSKITSAKRTGDDLMQDNTEEEPRKRLKWTSKGKTGRGEQEEPKEFNPKVPNFLPLEAEQEAERVDLRHQTIDEQRNSEEWMLDYALRQAVSKLAPARSKKVALLVEAFEKVMPPVPKWHASLGFPQSPRPIQACS